jgi:hypothetical protein
MTVLEIVASASLTHASNGAAPDRHAPQDSRQFSGRTIVLP